VESKINKTLLNRLFIKPEPLERKAHIFFDLHQRMFPCKEMFKAFLSTADASEQLEQAKYILQRLCFEANFPPPYSLLLNLVTFEKDTLNQSSNKKYIPQDHFSHIVYIYLLGLYIFFYSPLFNKKLTGEFIRRRAEPNFDLALDATKDFISFWKYFCLFHDVAYPIERSCQPQVEDCVLNTYLKEFNHLSFCLSREILIEGASKYLVVWQMLHDTNNNLPFNQVLNSLRDEVFIERPGDIKKVVADIRSELGEYKAVDKLHCFEHFKMLTGFIPEGEYIVVLFDALSEHPIAFKKTGLSQPTYYILQNKYISIPENKIILYLDHEDYLFDHNYFVRYYFKDLDSKINKMYLYTSAGEQFDSDTYQIILDGIQELSDSSNKKFERTIWFKQINTSSDLSAYMFQCYQTLLSYTNELYPPTQGLPYHTGGVKSNNSRKKISKYLDDNFKQFFKNAVIEQLPFADFKAAEQLLDELERESIGVNEIQPVISKAVDALFCVEKMEMYKYDIKKRFTGDLQDALTKEARLNSAIVEFILQCNRNLFLTNLAKSNSLEFINGNGIDVEKLLGALLANTQKKYLDKLEQNLTAHSGKCIELLEFIKQYKTDYLSYDHGIYGACIFLLCSCFYSEVIETLFGPPLEDKLQFKNIMSTLCWNIENSRYQNKLKGDYDYITFAVFASIFYHNLYPDYIQEEYKNPKMKWEYDFFREPSNYFGMMVDTLQVWNRNKYYRHSDLNWWPAFSSDCYDIDIKDGKIILHIKDYSDNIRQIAEKFLNEKDTYLKDFSTFVAIDIQHS